jgi:hypothetical protein
LAKKDKTFYQLDKFCKELDVELLTSQLDTMDIEYKRKYKSLTPEERRYERSLMRLVRDWRNFRLAFPEISYETNIDVMDYNDGVISRTYVSSCKRDFIYTEYDSFEENIIERDAEGNIIEVFNYELEYEEDEEYQPKSKLDVYSEWEYVISSSRIKITTH